MLSSALPARDGKISPESFSLSGTRWDESRAMRRGGLLMLLSCLKKEFIYPEYAFPRFIFPPFRYMYGTLLETTAFSYRAETFARIAGNLEMTAGEKMFKTILPSETWTTAYKEASTWLLVLETLLRLELEKRKNGSYPEQTPSWFPADPFGASRLRYLNGNMTVVERVYNTRTGLFDRVDRTVRAVCVWSIGANGTDEKGIDFYDKYGRDDIRAMVRL